MSQSANQQTALNHWLRLGIPCCLGALAGVFNYMTIKENLTSTSFCVITETIPAGGVVSSDVISTCEITDGSQFMKYAVPFSHAQGFLGTKAAHRIDKNSILLWQHLSHNASLPIGKGNIEIGFNKSQLNGVDIPEQIIAGDRLLLQIENAGKYKELGPFTVSKVAYTAGENGKSFVDVLKIILRKKSRHYGEIMGIKRSLGQQLVHISRAS